jgi:uncharacterized membrane protein
MSHIYSSEGERQKFTMRSLFIHIKTYIFRGLIAVIPLALTVLVIQFLYSAIDQRIMGLVDELIGFKIPGLGTFLLLTVLYLLGFTASNVVGKKIFVFAERITKRIHLINTTYHVGKQLSATLSLPEGQVFKRAVLVEYLKPGIWTIGFVTGNIIDRKNGDEKLLKVFIPTPPNPTSGTMVLVRESQIRDPGWIIEDAMKAVISGGIIGPTEICN